MSEKGDPVLDAGAWRIYREIDGLDQSRALQSESAGEAPRRAGFDVSMLDEDAIRVYEEFGGLDTDSRASDIIGWATGLAKVLSMEARPSDAWRVALIDFAHRLALCLAGFTLSFKEIAPEDEIEELLDALTLLSRMPDHGGSLLVRYRGLERLEESAPHFVDYTISFGNLVLDIPAAHAAARRDLATLGDSPKQLKKAFQRLAAVNIDNLRVAIGGWGPVDRERMRVCFQTLRRYCMEAAGETPITFDEAGASNIPAVVLDERGQPDPNLTLFAGLNRLSENTVRELVRKVNAFMHQPGTAPTLDQYANVFEAIFAFRNLRLQVSKPPVEVNNVRWLVADDKGVADPAEIRSARKVMDMFGDQPQKAGRIINGLHRRDFGGLGAQRLARRLESVSEYVAALEEAGGGEAVTETLGALRARLDEVEREVIASLEVGEGRVRFTPKRGEPVDLPLHPKVAGLLEFFHRRDATREKIRTNLGRPIKYETQDYEIVAADFGIDPERARRLLDLMRACFTPEGRFIKSVFESSIPEFARHGGRVFEFLWHYLKRAMARADRVAFLGALIRLIDQMDQNVRAIRTLLSDFISAPDAVHYYDRNALMLAIVLTRKYNKEITTDLEFTPDDVLLVSAGLDQNVIAACRKLIDENQERFFQKIKAVHKFLKDSIDIEEEEEDPVMPPPYLVTLEKEAVIFLSLVGGPAARMIVRAVLHEFGDPETEIYRRRQSRKYMHLLIPVLEIAVRGLSRFKNPEDREMLEDVINMKRGLFALHPEDEGHMSQVRRVLKRVNAALSDLPAVGTGGQTS